jgi:CheY-like chemotaxis protein
VYLFYPLGVAGALERLPRRPEANSPLVAKLLNMKMLNRTILLVEDNEDDVFMMNRAFKKAHITNPVQLVVDGQSAINYLSGEGIYQDRQQFPFPSLVLLDLKLPIKTGHEVLQWIRERPEFNSLLVVVLTTSAENIDVENAYRHGANSYLVKPPSAEALLEMVKALKLYWLEFNEIPA